MASSDRGASLGSGLEILSSEMATHQIAEPQSSSASSEDSSEGGGARLSDTYSFPASSSSRGAPTPKGSDSDSSSQILPLRGLDLQSKPFIKRAIAWSCDAELAVAADDSVHVFLPEFPALEEDGALKTETGQAESSDFPEEHYEVEEDDDEIQFLGAIPLVTSGRQQFFDGARQFPVTYPPLNTEINRHIWDAAGLDYPELDEPPQTYRFDETGDSRFSADPYLRLGAGARLIGSAGSTMNHVVSIEWSPSGLGRNGRPVLGVLTASGVLALYGEGSPNISSGSKVTRSTVRDLSRWVTLWAVGEKFVVPGQDNYGERIISFAWAPQLDNGGALLAYLNDEQELVILSIHAEYVAGLVSETKEEEAVWYVREAFKNKIAGPHLVLDQWDPDYTPSGSAFALRWSPWVKGEKEWTCVLSYIDKNYVGFRKVTFQPNADRPEGPDVQVGETDWNGICLFLAPDAFVEFESMIWSRGDNSQICRGVIATPFKAHTFEFDIVKRNEKLLEKHSTEICKTTYREANDKSCNLIQGLIVHPPNLAASMTDPIYTLVRLSATATNNDWYESNAPGSSDPAQALDQRPQWALEIARKISVATPAGLNPDVDESDDESGDSDKGGGVALVDSDDDSDDENLGFMNTGPDIHPIRLRLWGIAQSPGGGSTVVLSSPQMTQFPERGGWHNSRSTVMFGWAAQDNRSQQLSGPLVTNQSLTTEGRVWEWMYGRGAGVPGVTSAAGNNETDSGAQAARERVKHLFAEALRNQKCVICGGVSTIRTGSVESVCEKDHIFATCGASDLAIQAPGISRACGVCRCRCLRVEELAKAVPNKADLVRAEVHADECMKCGGKFID